MTFDPKSPHFRLATRLAQHFSQYPQVQAIALAGSQTAGGNTDLASDIDVYIYQTSIIPVSERQEIVKEFGATQADLDLQYWDLGDEWIHAETGIEVDLIYWDWKWIEEQIDRVLEKHLASTGYTTCFWNTLRSSHILFDRSGWLGALIEKCRQPYPEALRRAIIEKNYPLLRQVIPSYQHQIEKAVQRGDLVSINHRLAAFLASYFDILFALNRLPHPGEKRLLEKAVKQCPILPANMVEQINAMLLDSGKVDASPVTYVNLLVDGLEPFLREADYDPDKARFITRSLSEIE